ncbi:MAG: hypothetical protein M1381_08250 [Deltaproteobacteria bacterium]|nr:hypothetical protein [Deltaproteobacteria bacterium]
MQQPISNENDARRLARAIASDIALYNQEKVKQGIENDNFYEVMKDEMDEGRILFISRLSPDSRDNQDMLRVYDRAIADVIIKLTGQKIKSKIW